MRVIDNIGKFTLARTQHNYIVINTEEDYKHHSHFKTENGARTFLELIGKGLLPRSRYFKEAARRLLCSEEYKGLMECRKEKYINVNKGAR